MPTYGYICTSCGHQEDRLQKISDAPLTVCPQCHNADFQRQISAGIGVSFRGSGFYETDYNRSPPKDPCPCGKKEKSSCTP